MDKDLPNIYKGVVNTNNNQNESVLGEEKEKITIDNKDIKKDINRIFNSPSFIYKADVLITLSDSKTIKKTIIGKNNNSLITIDDELININNISKIEKI